jgi:tetratricopeptide (TPR) repeat protein
MNMLRVAQSLIRLGEKKKAEELLDLYFKHFPMQKFSVEMDYVYYADLYYKAGQIDKANKLVEQMAKIYKEDLEYYYSFTGDFAEAYKDDIQTSLEVIRSLQMLASQNKQEKLEKQIEDIFNREASKFKQ